MRYSTRRASSRALIVPLRVLRTVVSVACSLALIACEQADRFAGGIDLDSPPPVVDGTMMVLVAAPSDTLGSSDHSALDADRNQPVPSAPAPSPASLALPSIASSSATSTAMAPSHASGTPTPSTLATPVVVSPAAAVDTSRTQRPARERSEVLLSADRAFASRSGCSEAVRLYASVPRPTDLNGPDGTDWVTAQLRTAQCSIELREWTRALDAIALVKASRPREWSAAYFEGHVYCQMGQFDRGTKAFRDLTGLMGTLGTGARQAVTLLSKYGTATCDRMDYEASRQPERNKDQLELFLGEYEEFLKGADRIQATGGVPSEYAREVSLALKSARDHVTKYSKP